MRADQLERDASVVDFTARLLAGLVRTDNLATLRTLLPDALPWSVFLPDEDVRTMLAELAETARGAAALENLTPIALLLTQWRHTAEIHADPELHATLTREPEGDLGPVPAPAFGRARMSPKRGDRAAPRPSATSTNCASRPARPPPAGKISHGTLPETCAGPSTRSGLAHAPQTNRTATTGSRAPSATPYGKGTPWSAGSTR
ncbi:hypothetical protein AB0L47_08275 [Streptomyces bobili]|uniref:hypothetical protein n=1 Tax=Streptomyces bobili TaxID=67280 RepID=UPI00341B02A8